MTNSPTASKPISAALRWMRRAPRWSLPTMPAIALALALLVPPLPVLAGGFSILPTRLQMSADNGVQSVLLTNTSGAAVTLESQVIVWSEGDTAQQANDVVVSPAVVTLPPGQRMRVRIGLLRSGAGQQERAYRLYFTELLPPAPLQGAGIGVRLRVGIPLFVAPRRPAPAALVWTVARDGDAWQLRAQNPGNVHTRATDVVLVHPNGNDGLELTSSYVLAGATTRISLPVAPVQPVSMNGWRVRWKEGDDVRDAAVATLP